MTQQKRRVLYAKQDEDEIKLTVSCRFFPSRSYVNSESPVMCNENDKMNYNGKNKCEHCGWNPLVKAERLRKVYGDKKTNSAISYSQSITEGTNAEYRKEWGDYKPKKGEHDV